MQKLYVKDTKIEVNFGSKFTVGSTGEEYLIISGTPPHRQGSSGRVYVQAKGETQHAEFFPHVLGLEWREESDVKCITCNGKGVILISNKGFGKNDKELCGDCEGSGYISASVAA